MQASSTPRRGNQYHHRLAAFVALNEGLSHAGRIVG
jgi:hypothetical protein